MARFKSDIDAENLLGIDKMDTEYKLYAHNLPQELNEDGIREIFSQYGKITGMFYRCNSTWSFITYATYREAEYAIRELNNKKPLYLRVAFAKEKTVSKNESVQSQQPEAWQINEPRVVNNITEPPTDNCNEHRSQNIGRGQQLSMLCKRLEIAQTATHKRTENESLDSQISSINENEGPFINTNKLWTRGTVNITGDGKRHVSLGRGYTLYEFPNHNPKIEDHIIKVCKQRNIGLYEYGQDKLNNGVQKCFVCSNKTTKHCEKCYTYYCSRVCQATDWPRHQTECQRLPALVEEINNDVSLMQVSKDEKQILKSDIIYKSNAFNDVQLRRPGKPIEVEASNNMNTYTKANQTNIDSTVSSTTDKYDSNNANISQTKKTDHLTMNKINGKNLPEQDRLQKYNHTNKNIDQMRTNDEHFSPARSNSGYQNHSNGYHKNYTIDRSMINPTESIVNDNVKDKSYNPGKAELNQEKFQNEGNRIYDREPVNKQEKEFNNVTVEDLASHKNIYLSKTEFTDVEIITPLNNDEYWIYKVENANVYADLMTKLQNVAVKSHNVKPNIGDVYAVVYKAIWRRAMVISLNPLTVHFLDFGNDEVLKKDAELRDIQNLRKIPRLARKIRLTQAASEKYPNLQCGDKLSVKMLSMNAEKVMIVEVKEQIKDSSLSSSENVSQSNIVKHFIEKYLISEDFKVLPNTDIKASAIQLPSILDAIAELFTHKTLPELELAGIIQIHEVAQKNLYKATLFPHVFTTDIDRILNELPLKCAQMEKCIDYKPCVGDLVCGEAENGEWYRGYVSTLLPNLHIAVMDEARIMSVDQILPYPKEFQNICSFGVICEATSDELQIGVVYQFTAVINEYNRKQENIKIKITKDQDTLTALIKAWKPDHQTLSISLPPEFAELKSKSKVCLTSYRNQYFMFARSLDDVEIEYYNNIMQRVAQCAQTALHLPKHPNIGDLVIAPYCDGNNYRGMVTKIQDDKVTIVYVDFGNLENVDIKKLKVLPKNLAMQRSCTAKITLKDVSRDVPMTKTVDNYLRDLVGKEVPLTCVCNDVSSNYNVRLTMPTGENVNSVINELLEPSWKQENYDDKTCYMVQHIDVASLGSIGDTVDALILLVKENGLKYMMCPIDIDLMTHVFDVMPTLLKEYCEKTEYYIPRTQELCLALYENAWYRALCIDPRESDTTCKIFFVDYGNMESVEFKNIRLMPIDFITPAATANMCMVVNLAPINNSGDYSAAVKNKISELVRPESIVKIKIVECSEIGDYKIELPVIHAALIEQNLI